MPENNFFEEMMGMRCEYTGEKRTVEEIRYRDGAQWFRAEDSAIELLSIFCPIAERRTVRQARMRYTYPNGHIIEGWVKEG